MGRFVIILLFIVPMSMFGQDPHYSQFYASPMELNPAMTGVFDGQFRATINYRDQWSSLLNTVPFRTIGAGFDARFHVVNDDFFTLGMDFVRDEVGIGRFNQTMGHLSAGFMKRLHSPRYGDGDHFLIAGAQVGFGQNSISWSNLWFGRQFNKGTEQVDMTSPTGEGGINGNLGMTSLYLNMNIGLMWYMVFDNNRSIYIGGALDHINSPNISLLDNGNESLYRKYTIHGGGEFPLTDEITVLPAALILSQGPSFQANLGSNLRYSHKDWRELAVRAGLWTRVARRLDGSSIDALIFTTIFEVETWNIGLSYDVTTSVLSRANNNRGAFELSMIYVYPQTKRRYKIVCPKF